MLARPMIALPDWPLARVAARGIQPEQLAVWQLRERQLGRIGSAEQVATLE